MNLKGKKRDVYNSMINVCVFSTHIVYIYIVLNDFLNDFRGHLLEKLI